MGDSFQNSRLKLARATHHTAELEAEVAAFMARAPVKIITTQNPNPNYLDWAMVCNEGVPEHLAAILGDIIHNLRVSLDLLATELVRCNGEDAKSVYFPFAERKEEIDVVIKRRNFHKAPPEAIDLVKRLGPYKGGNIVLRYVHDLDIIDKHQSLIPAASYVTTPSGGLGFDDSGPIPGHVHGHGTTLMEIALHKGFSPNKEFAAVFVLRFPFRGPFEDMELVQTCKMLIDEFTRIIDAFEALTFGAIS